MNAGAAWGTALGGAMRTSMLGGVKETDWPALRRRHPSVSFFVVVPGISFCGGCTGRDLFILLYLI